MAHMGQCEQTTLYYRTEGETGYVDLASSMTAANRVQYHQVSSSGNPNCFTVMITALKSSFAFWHLQNQFATCRAVKQTSEGWKTQLRHGGVKLADLPPYGRRARFALEAGSYVKDSTAISGEDIYTLSKLHLPPLMSTNGNEFFGWYMSTDGMRIAYEARDALVAGSLSANHITQVTVTDGDGAESNVPLVVSGDGVSGEFNVITQYMKARRQTPDVSIDTPGPEEGSDMLNLFSIAEEMSDDIVDAVDDYMDWKPYTPDNGGTGTSYANFDALTEAGECSTVTAVDTQYPPNFIICDVPLGLLKVLGASDTDFRIDVLAIYEME